jgi:hypothetical protein
MTAFAKYYLVIMVAKLLLVFSLVVALLSYFAAAQCAENSVLG